ncbi:Uncharacterised protein [Mycobacteroides abscessus subsp. abscessus]|uniref:hypothetical protein n=1 Tax=Mycobacteroides abscessus TaxID=36809 RepID=UPI00092970AF|nr:hypothetical protein [Mycobacteroides abscessus]SHU69597.1 Uncharacterised protein [Mycobacteroides abscessus subsp. abscessus]
MSAAISLTTNGDTWQGTFRVAVRALAADLLGDGEPVTDVTLDTERHGRITGTLLGVADDILTIRVGPVNAKIEISDNVTGFHVD